MVPEKNVLPSLNTSDIPEMDEGWWRSIISEDIPEEINHIKDSSKLPADFAGDDQVDWTKVRCLFDNDEVVKLKVYGYNRGGILVEGTGIHGFVPVSHLVDFSDDTNVEIRKERLSRYTGRQVNLKVIECQPSLERIVFSERAALTGDGSRKKVFQSLKTGETAVGVVTNITDFGVFVDLGGVEGLIHVSELSWGRVQHPNKILKLGQHVTAVVLKVSQENSRVGLSLKRLSPNPWETLANVHQPGDRVKATVTTVMEFGVFARLEEGIEGLIHVSSIDSRTPKVDIHNLFTPGQSIDVEILHIDAARRRLGLALLNPQ